MWSCLGDDFDTYPRETYGVRKLGLTLQNEPELLTLAREVIRVGRSSLFISNNAGKYQVNIRWTNLRDVTDSFDKAALNSLGLGHEWRNLNIWYREVMKSTGENANGRYLTPEEIEKLNLDW